MIDTSIQSGKAASKYQWNAITSIIVIIGTLAAIVWGAVQAYSSGWSSGWNSAKDQISDEINTRKLASDVRLPEVLAEMRTLSGTLSQQVFDRGEYERLKTVIGTAQTKIAELVNEAASLKAENDRLRTQLAAYVGNSFELRTGEPRFVIDRRVALTVLHPMQNMCKIQLGRETRYLNVGEDITTLESPKTRIVLMGSAAGACRFSITAE